ncbi:MAG: hypothetical protein ACWA5P_13675 [bacterium]
MNPKLILLLFLLPTLTFSQTSFAERNPKIIQYKEFVNKLTDTTMVILNNENFTSNNYDHGSSLKAVYLNKELVKISTWFGLSYGINTVDYYLQEDKLVYVEEVFKGFKYDDENNEFDYSEFDIGAAGWYLFNSGELIDTESLGHWRFEDDSLNPEEILLLEFSEYYTRLKK